VYVKKGWCGGLEDSPPPASELVSNHKNSTEDGPPPDSELEVISSEIHRAFTA
jgi:hypothetical protein